MLTFMHTANGAAASCSVMHTLLPMFRSAAERCSILVIAIFLVACASGQADTMFTEGFESGGFTAGGWTNSGAVVQTTYKHAGTYGAELNSTDSLTKVLSTRGYNAIGVTYYSRIRGFSGATTFVSEWYNGTTWATINTETANTASFQLRTFNLPAGASDNANFRLRFKITSGASTKYVELDDVQVTGTRIEYTLTLNTTGGPGYVDTSASGPYHYNDTVTLTSVPHPRYAFNHWTGGLSGSTNPAALTITGNTTVTAVLNQTEYCLKIDNGPYTSVTASPAPPYSYNQQVTLTCSPFARWSFAGWTGDISSTQNPVTITMNADKTVHANVTQTEYRLTAECVGGGTISRSASAPYAQNQQVTLTATANPGWTFNHWYFGLTGYTNPQTVTLDNDKTVTAHFDHWQSVLSNGGFEAGTVAEAASNTGIHDGFWFAGDCGGNAISLSSSVKRSGSYSMKLNPIGWGRGDDGNCGTSDDADAQILIFNNADPFVQNQCTAVQFSGYVNTAELQSGKNAQMLLIALDSAGTYIDGAATGLYAGGAAGWQNFTATLNLGGEEAYLFVYLTVPGSARAGATGSIYWDDLSLVYYDPTYYVATVGIANTSVNTVKPELFGDNVEWLDSGLGLYNDTSSSFDPYAMAILQNAGVKHLRYPGGCHSDLFHWAQTIGADPKRQYQKPAFSGDYQYPYFGFPEFASLCSQLNCGMTLTLNAASGTAQEAADWAKYAHDHAYSVKSYTLGNEVHLQGDPNDPTYMTPAEYASMWTATYAAVQSAVPGTSLGAIGIADLPDCWQYNAHKYSTQTPAQTPPAGSIDSDFWLDSVIPAICDKVAFIDTHTGYAPVVNTTGVDFWTRPSEEAFAKAYLAQSLAAKAHIDRLKTKLATLAGSYASGINVQLTEQGPLIYPYVSGYFFDDLAWNTTLMGALYEATLFNYAASEPRITLMAHMPLYQYGFAALCGVDPGTPSSAWKNVIYYVFQKYAAMAGRSVLQTTVDSPTYDCDRTGFQPALSGVPYLDVASFKQTSPEQITIFVVNRSMYQTALAILDPPYDNFNVTALTTLSAPDYADSNSSSYPDKVAPVDDTTVPHASSNGRYTVEVPKHSLVIVTIAPA